jgi:hypothetical protein
MVEKINAVSVNVVKKEKGRFFLSYQEAHKYGTRRV